MARIAPITRVEGHAKAVVSVDASNVITSAELDVMMYRGFESFLYNTVPEDTVRLTSRICGVCPTPHSLASAKAWESSRNISISANAERVRYLMECANLLHSAILHWYFLAGPDFVANIQALWGDATVARQKAQKILALLGAKGTHSAAIIVGGHTRIPSAATMATIKTYLVDIENFINNTYVPLVQTSAMPTYGTRPARFISSGTYFAPGVMIDGVSYAFDPANVVEDTHPNSYTKKVSYLVNGTKYVCEAGPLARMSVGGQMAANTVNSIANRNLARALEAQKVVLLAKNTADAILTYEDARGDVKAYTKPNAASGIGVTEAPRGTLIHRVSESRGYVSSYNLTVSTTFNSGAIEEALIGAPLDGAEKVIRSFDPCFSCSAHNIEILVR